MIHPAPPSTVDGDGARNPYRPALSSRWRVRDNTGRRKSERALLYRLNPAATVAAPHDAHGNPRRSGRSAVWLESNGGHHGWAIRRSRGRRRSSGPCHRLLACPAETVVRHPRGRRLGRHGVAEPLGFVGLVHVLPVWRTAGPGLPWRSRRLSEPPGGDQLPRTVRLGSSTCPSSRTARCAPSPRRTIGSCSTSASGAS